MANDMDLPPQNNGKTQPFVNHRNVRTLKYKTSANLNFKSPEKNTTSCLHDIKLHKSRVEAVEDMDTSDDPMICVHREKKMTHGFQVRAQESNGNTQMHVDNSTTSNLGLGCHALAPRDSDEEMEALCREMANLNLKSPVEEEDIDTSDDPEICEFQGRAQESNGNTQMHVDNSTTSNLGLGCHALAPRDSDEEMEALCREMANLNLKSPVEEEDIDTSDDPEICEFQGRAQESNGNTQMHVDNSTTSNLGLGCHALAPRDSDEEMEALCREMANLNLKSPVEEEDIDTSDDPEICEFQGRAQESNGNTQMHVDNSTTSNLGLGCHALAPRDSDEEMEALCREMANLNLKSPVEEEDIDTSDDPEICEFQGRAQESNGNTQMHVDNSTTSNLGLGCHALAPRDSDEEMEALCREMANLNLKSPVEEDIDTSDDPEICEFQGRAQESNGNTQMHVDNSTTSNLGLGCHALAPRDSDEEMEALCREMANLNLKSPVEEEDIDTSDDPEICEFQGRAQESNGNTQMHVDNSTTSNLGLGCHALAPRDSDEEMEALCREMANLNLKSPVEEDIDTSDDPEICEFQGRAQESNGNTQMHVDNSTTSNLGLGCHALAPRDSDEEMEALCREMANLNLKSPVEEEDIDTSDDPEICEFQGRAQESNGNTQMHVDNSTTSNLGLGCHALAPRDSDEEMEALCREMANLNLKSPVEEDIDTSDDPEICEFQGFSEGNTDRSSM